MIYIINFFDTKDVENIKSNQAKQYWPQKIIEFFEKRIEWIQPASADDGGSDPIETTNPQMDVTPQEISCNYY